MPGPFPAVTLPAQAKFEVVEGQGFIRVREAARLGGIHPVVLEMGQKLLKTPGSAGVAFALATPDLKAKADGVQRTIKGGLRKVVKALGDGKHKYKVMSHRDGDRLVFWIT